MTVLRRGSVEAVSWELTTIVAGTRNDRPRTSQTAGLGR